MGYQGLFLEACPGTKAQHRAAVNAWRRAEDKMVGARTRARQNIEADASLVGLLGCERQTDTSLDNEAGEPYALP